MDIQGCWAAMAPSRKEDVCRSGAGARHQAGSLFDGSQSCRLGSTEENIPDRIVAGNSVSVSPTTNYTRSVIARARAKCGRIPFFAEFAAHTQLHSARARAIKNGDGLGSEARINCAQGARLLALNSQPLPHKAEFCTD